MERLRTLISWGLNNGLERIDSDRAYLAGLMLSWFLTASHRVVRDKATKALASILACRLGLAARLVRDFAPVDDPYVRERLVCACYGAVLQGRTGGLAELSQTVFQAVFADGAPPPDALLRDHAQGLIEYASKRGFLPKAGRQDGTLICHFRQRAHENPFIHPGLQDISAWVDFTALAEACSAARCELAGFTTQAYFLAGLRHRSGNAGPRRRQRGAIRSAGESSEAVDASG